MDEKEIKKKLLGTTKKIKATGGHKVNPKKIHSPLEGKNVIHYFCTGCGTTSQLSRKVSNNYLENSLSETIKKGSYIEGVGCEACTAEMTKFELKKI